MPGQAWLQQFSWTEAGKPAKLEQRRRLAREDSAAREALDHEPMFCFETAIKLYYFSHIIYYYEKVHAAPLLCSWKFMRWMVELAFAPSFFCLCWICAEGCRSRAVPPPLMGNFPGLSPPKLLKACSIRGKCPGEEGLST